MTHEPRPALLRAALDAAEQGWAVIPLRPDDKRPALHGKASCPGIGDCLSGHRKWEQRATTDPDRIRAAWTRLPFNIGIVTGPSGLVVIDLDMPKNKSKKDTPCGVTTFKALCERTGHPVPATRTVRTASGGRHLYFTAPAGVRLGNTASKLGPLIDTRAWGGYVVAEGSVVAGGVYQSNHAPAAPLPQWLTQPLTASPAPPRPARAPQPGRGSAYAEAALRNETANVERAPEGSRNATLVRAARALGRLITSGDLDRTRVEEALNWAGISAGLRERECAAALTSALNWSIAHNTGRRTA
ncbi:bifunctional DNA primase/polymerase [Streptomyces sp. NPDC001633]|uniref:bifunctional DNA primase/polymerase n=1 Tax=Streptomyces sp. NPDC001633 TaxID=3364595 RepID=UPI0036840997